MTPRCTSDGSTPFSVLRCLLRDPGYTTPEGTPSTSGYGAAPFQRCSCGFTVHRQVGRVLEGSLESKAEPPQSPPSEDAGLMCPHWQGFCPDLWRVSVSRGFSGGPSGDIAMFRHLSERLP